MQEMSTDKIERRILTLADIPPPNAEWDRIIAFALTYSGYEESRSFDACAKIANERRHDTLTELRTCLFFEQRRWHHFGAAPDKEAMTHMRSLIQMIRAKVQKGEAE